MAVGERLHLAVECDADIDTTYAAGECCERHERLDAYPFGDLVSEILQTSTTLPVGRGCGVPVRHAALPLRGFQMEGMLTPTRATP
jgi:hypothetical protein